jgi:Transcriptional regulator
VHKDDLDGLIALKAVAEKKNFREAAESLSISTAAISKTIKQVEQRLGVTLLSRTTRSTSLTEAGERFLSKASPAIDQLIAAIAEVSDYSEKPAGLLRINLPKLIYPNYLAPLIASFSKKHPEITVELCFEDGATDVIEKGFDAGIRVSDILAQDMVAIKLLGPITWVVVGSPKYLNKAGRPKLPKDLLNHNCIRTSLGSWIYDNWEFEQKGKPFQVHVKGSLLMNDSVFALKAAEDGIGLTYLAEDSCREQLKSGKLERVLNAYSPSSTGYYLYYPQRSQVQPKLRAFIEHVKNPTK